MSIIVSRNGRNARRLERSVIEQEEYLQQYVHASPEILPLHELKDGVRLLVIAREFPTGSGPIDALGVDQDGDVYVIETKLYKNPDKRRVIAQMLDYGASLGTTYAEPAALTAALERRLGDEHASGGVTGRLQEHFGMESDAVPGYLERVFGNVSAGLLKFVVLMDRLDDRLKDLIRFVNRNSNFDILGVELDFYRDGEMEILIPNLFGAEAAKTAPAAGASIVGKRGTWNEQVFFDRVAQQLDETALSAIRQVYGWAQKHADAVTWGTGREVGSFSAKFLRVSHRSIFTVSSDGSLSINVGWLMEPEPAFRCASVLADGVRRLGIADIPDSFRERYPKATIDRWAGLAPEFLRVVEEAVAASAE